ncbi:xanthine dehydrogenase [filamentous cyanobacterium CCP5]|nr:xanthine dehydrogenase [filamentous cyanobacterium CCP5]
MGEAFYQQLAERLNQGPVAVAIVVDGQGSVPREVGAKMLIGADGPPIDTIGGGAGEAKVIAAAQTVLATGQPQMVKIDLSGVAQRSIEGICGGWMRVWVERWQPEYRGLLRQLLDRLNHQPTYLVVPLGPNAPYLLDHPPGPQVYQASYVERLQPSPLLLIVGAGHVGLALASTAEGLGFTVVVQDDRPDFANGDRFPTATEIWTESVGERLPLLPTVPDLYIALVTRGLAYDVAALEAILTAQRPYRYLGMIGSRKRVKRVMEALIAQGYGVPPSPFYAPIGLPINAFTPEEIAVSICAQLIQVRRSPTNVPSADVPP